MVMKGGGVAQRLGKFLSSQSPLRGKQPLGARQDETGISSCWILLAMVLEDARVPQALLPSLNVSKLCEPLNLRYNGEHRRGAVTRSI